MMDSTIIVVSSDDISSMIKCDDTNMYSHFNTHHPSDDGATTSIPSDTDLESDHDKKHMDPKLRIKLRRLPLPKEYHARMNDLTSSLPFIPIRHVPVCTIWYNAHNKKRKRSIDDDGDTNMFDKHVRMAHFFAPILGNVQFLYKSHHCNILDRYAPTTFYYPNGNNNSNGQKDDARTLFIYSIHVGMSHRNMISFTWHDGKQWYKSRNTLMRAVNVAFSATPHCPHPDRSVQPLDGGGGAHVVTSTACRIMTEEAAETAADGEHIIHSHAPSWTTTQQGKDWHLQSWPQPIHGQQNSNCCHPLQESQQQQQQYQQQISLDHSPYSYSWSSIGYVNRENTFVSLDRFISAHAMSQWLDKMDDNLVYESWMIPRSDFLIPGVPMVPQQKEGPPSLSLHHLPLPSSGTDAPSFVHNNAVHSVDSIIRKKDMLIAAVIDFTNTSSSATQQDTTIHVPNRQQSLPSHRDHTAITADHHRIVNHAARPSIISSPLNLHHLQHDHAHSFHNDALTISITHPVLVLSSDRATPLHISATQRSAIFSPKKKRHDSRQCKNVEDVCGVNAIVDHFVDKKDKSGNHHHKRDKKDTSKTTITTTTTAHANAHILPRTDTMMSTPHPSLQHGSTNAVGIGSFTKSTSKVFPLNPLIPLHRLSFAPPMMMVPLQSHTRKITSVSCTSRVSAKSVTAPKMEEMQKCAAIASTTVCPSSSTFVPHITTAPLDRFLSSDGYTPGIFHPPYNSSSATPVSDRKTHPGHVITTGHDSKQCITDIESHRTTRPSLQSKDNQKEAVVVISPHDGGRPDHRYTRISSSHVSKTNNKTCSPNATYSNATTTDLHQRVKKRKPPPLHQLSMQCHDDSVDHVELPRKRTKCLRRDGTALLDNNVI